MKLYRYRVYWRDGRFTKEGLEVIEKPKAYLMESRGRRLSKSEVGVVVDDILGNSVLYLTEDNDTMARTLFIQHFSAKKAKEDERHQRAISKIENMMVLLDNSPVIEQE